MNNLRFYWEFHKSTVLVNWAFSIGGGILFSMLLTPILSILVISMTGGPLISLFYKEVSQQNEYYFYYNRGISKHQLIAVNLLFNLVIGLILISIIQYAKLT